MAKYDFNDPSTYPADDVKHDPNDETTHPMYVAMARQKLEYDRIAPQSGPPVGDRLYDALAKQRADYDASRKDK
jgi:hypothetical protein